LRAEPLVGDPINRVIVPRHTPTLSHDRIILAPEDYARIRARAVMLLVVGLLFPPLWVLMGWAHVLDSVVLPPVFGTQREAVWDVYRPYRVVAAGLGGVVVVGSLVGVVVGGLALGGVIA
jgi:hypothetical protein